MKRKFTASVALAVAGLIVLTGMALAAGLNLFEHFGGRYAQIAPDAQLATQAPVTTESEALGESVARVNSAYYDGQSLLVGFVLENASRMERFTPTDEQLAQMSREPGPAALTAPSSDAEQAILAEYAAAIQSGTPYGVARYSILPGDHTLTDDGIDLPPSTEMDEPAPDGGRYYMREYETPLPEAAQNRDALRIRIPLRQSSTLIYFDGTDFYVASESAEIEPMTATIPRADAQTTQFSGSGQFSGAAIRVSASVSRVRAIITITADADAFPPLGADMWYNLVVLDESGNSLRTEGVDFADARTLVVPCEGTGKLPEALEVYVLVCSEGEWDKSAAMAAATPIVLAPAE